MSDDNRGLRRALQIERETRRLYAARLRGLLSKSEYSRFLEFCRAEAFARCELKLANSGGEVRGRSN